MFEKEEQPTPEYQFPEYSEEELVSFERSNEKYWRKKVYPTGEEVPIFDTHQFLVDAEGVSKDGAVIINVESKNANGTIKRYTYPPKYELLKDKIKKWRKWREGKNFGRQRQLEDWQTTYDKK